MNLPIATYRLQLRGGVDFDAAIAFLPHLNDMGISHLYLSPIFTAACGSTHGYDVTDPTQIDAALGGRAGFDRLAAAAQAAGIGLILDLVPNHTAFDLSNPWLADVLHHGPNSRFARHFDIYWDEGALVLPWLEEPFEAAVAAGRVARDGDTLRIGDLAVPLRDGVEADSLIDLHEHQYWRLTHWARERDGVTHRRFFNVTGLIGMRVEDTAVFNDMHALVFDLAAAGQVQGLRLDHIDGLADPAGYLQALRRALPEMPIWVEKILTGDETLCDWPIQGTTGYEAATMISRFLADGDGCAQLLEAWRDQTGGDATFHDALVEAKGDVIRRDLAAELRHLITLAGRAIDPAKGMDPGDEALREALMALLRAFPRYRTYFTATDAPKDDCSLMVQVADIAAEGLRSRDVIDVLVGMIMHPQTAPETALQVRFQQVTGALLAKAHEDTAGFRWTPYLFACEVGADPDRPTATAQELHAWAEAQPGASLILTSSHDTKRSEDARMRLVAWTHRPDDALALLQAARALPEASTVPGNVIWYMVQSSLAIWDAADDALDRRLADHATKALREADENTSWTHPEEAFEALVQSFLSALVTTWRAAPPPALNRLIVVGERLALMQLVVKLMLSGIPDVYRGCETVHLALTDPDNRHPVDLATLRGAVDAPGLGGRKARLTRALLHLRTEHPGLFRSGVMSLDKDENCALTLKRSDDAGWVEVSLPGLHEDGCEVEVRVDFLGSSPSPSDTQVVA